MSDIVLTSAKHNIPVAGRLRSAFKLMRSAQAQSTQHCIDVAGIIAEVFLVELEVAHHAVHLPMNLCLLCAVASRQSKAAPAATSSRMPATGTRPAVCNV